MSSRGDFHTTEETARRLGVTSRRVQQMLDAGDLTRVARGLVDAASVDRHLAARAGGRTRAWAEHTAWGAIALLSGMRPEWLGSVQASRLRGALRGMTDPADLIIRTRDRAVVHTYSGHPSAAARMRGNLVAPDHSVLGVVSHAPIGDPEELRAGRGANPALPVDGYLAADRLEHVVRQLGLLEDPSGPLVVRATRFDLDVVLDLSARATILAALDAATSLDPRARGVAERTLAAALSDYRR